jgi:hypothetical protein
MSLNQIFTACSGLALGVILVELYNMYYSENSYFNFEQRIRTLEDFSRKQNEINDNLKNKIADLENLSSNKELYKEFEQNKTSQKSNSNQYFFGPQPL